MDQNQLITKLIDAMKQRHGANYFSIGRVAGQIIEALGAKESAVSHELKTDGIRVGAMAFDLGHQMWKLELELKQSKN